MAVQIDRPRALRIVWLSYVVALALAVATALLVGDAHPVEIAAWADVAGTLAIFLFSFSFDNSSFYDAYWSVAPLPIAIYWSLGADGDPLRTGLAIAAVAIWGARLTFNWARGWTGLDHEDWRYRNLREQTGAGYWLVSLAGLHFFPTLMVFLGCLPLYPALTASGRDFGALDVLGALLAATAIYIEARADKELSLFRRERPAPDAILASGLWRSSRHPNYFGEMLFWWSLYVFGMAADPSWWWTGVGPLAISLMFFFVSLPMIEKRMQERRPAYAEHAQRTSLVIPWFPR